MASQGLNDNIGLVLKQMVTERTLPSNGSWAVSPASDGTWEGLVLARAVKPPLEDAEAVWASIKPDDYDSDKKNTSILEALRDGSNSSGKALAVFLPVVEILEKYTVAGHLLSAQANISIAELCFTELVAVMENLPDDSGPTGSSWEQAWSNYKAMVMPSALESAIPSLTTEDDYRAYNDFCDDFIVNWGIKVLLST
jgi:hypothetical protein